MPILVLKTLPQISTQLYIILLVPSVSGMQLFAHMALVVQLPLTLPVGDDGTLLSKNH